MIRAWRVVLATLTALACAASGPSLGSGDPAPWRRTDTRRQARTRIRVALALNAQQGSVSALDDWRILGAEGTALVARSSPGETWRIERNGAFLRAVRPDGVPTNWRGGSLIVRGVDDDAMIAWNGRRYRGELQLIPNDSSFVVVNVVSLEDYLRGVVPGEIGDRSPAEHAAAEAQSVAARSYAVVRMRSSTGRGYDVQAGVADQVYGGADAERMVSDLAISATEGQVLLYAGRPVSAPYHSTCGGSTAAQSELFRAADEPHLQRVSDRIPGSDRYYCDVSPRFRWVRTIDGGTLERAMDTYLRQYAGAPSGRLGAVRAVRVDGRTASGRVAAMIVQTERGDYRVRGNDTRFVLRTPGGEILNSTYFSVAASGEDAGRISSLTVTGTGYGHGVGMCQWGAIGRARAGQDYLTILRTYYPGTTVGRVD